MATTLASLSFLLLDFLSVFLVFVSSAQDEHSSSSCPPDHCGKDTQIRFPFPDFFYPNCAPIPIYCQDSEPKIRSKGGAVFNVKRISNSSASVVIQDPRLTSYLQQRKCDSISKFQFPSFDYLVPDPSAPTLRLITCKPGYHSNLLKKFKSYSHCEDWVLYFSRPGDDEIDEAINRNCSSVLYCVLGGTPNVSEWENFDLLSVVSAGFAFQWDWNTVRDCDGCRTSGGTCDWHHATNFSCYCENQNSNDIYCDNGSGNKSKKRRIIIGLSAGASGLLLLILFYFLYYLHRHRNRKNLSPSSLYFTRSVSSELSPKPDPEKGSATHFLNHIPALSLFTYKELEQATNNFHPSNELGDGGFGTVYYGKLRDGRGVAVKRLYENNYKRVEQFMNEIEILSRLRHKNLVNLYGCTSRHSRELLLVYELVSNGTVSDHIHGDLSKTSGGLTWPTRLRIAVETADALAYLHHAEPPIIHRDVKTNNILLDSAFRVKVADFGLSRLFPMDVTHVSTAPQGTPGYVDPEYHQCYQLTDKSDVYSFGVVLVELISSKPAVDIARHRHEINLSNLAINKIINHALNELVDPGLGFESDRRVRKMMTAVAELAFRCLAAKKEERPTMDEVLEVLRAIEKEGSEGKIPAEKVDIMEDDVGLLKNQPPVSPDSVTVKWTSRSTTSNTSIEG